MRAGRDHASDGSLKAHCLALVGSRPRGGRGRAAARPPAPTGPAAGFGESGEGLSGLGDVSTTAPPHPLDTQGPGSRRRSRHLDCSRHPESPWPQAAPGQDLQAVQRPPLWHQGPGWGGALHEPAGSRGGALGGREDADLGARADTNALASPAWTGRDPHT